MKRFFVTLVTVSIIFMTYTRPPVRLTNYPFITGGEFRSIADLVLEDKERIFTADQVKDGSIIFIRGRTQFLDVFFYNIHPHINAKYILITHHALGVGAEKYIAFLGDDRLVAWFGKNLMIKHKKTFPIPLGIQDRERFNKVKFFTILAKLPLEKDTLLYMNFGVTTNEEERKPVYELFKDKAYCKHEKNKPFDEYIEDVARSKFNLSPAGAGTDCYRTWETLLVGSYPIVKSSGIDSLFDDLPVVIVKDWKEVDEQFLLQKYEELNKNLAAGKYNMEKLFADYWIEKLMTLKKEVIDSCNT